MKAYKEILYTKRTATDSNMENIYIQIRKEKKIKRRRTRTLMYPEVRMLVKKKETTVVNVKG